MNEASILGPRERLRRALVEALLDAAGPDAEASKGWCESVAGSITKRLASDLELDREEYRLMVANLTETQKRCTALFEENRDLRKKLLAQNSSGLEPLGGGPPGD